MDDREKDQKSQRVFKATPGPFVTYIVGVLVSVLVFVLLSGSMVFLSFSSSLQQGLLLLVVSVMCVFVLAFGIVCAVFCFRTQFGVAIDDDGIQITSRLSTGLIHWEQIAEIRCEKSFFGPFQPTTEAGKSAMRKKRWKDKTTGVRLSLIAQDGQVLAHLHSSSYKEYETIANLIETKTTQIQHRPTRDTENEKARALQGFRRRAAVHIVVDLIMLSVCLGYHHFARTTEEKYARLDEAGVVVQATVIKAESLGDETVLVKYDFVDTSNQLHSETKRVKRDAWEQRESDASSIEIIFDPADPKHNNPTNIPLDPVLLNIEMQIVFYYVLPAIFLPSLLLNIYQRFTRTFHYETDRYTIVKLGKPKT